MSDARLLAEHTLLNKAPTDSAFRGRMDVEWIRMTKEEVFGIMGSMELSWYCHEELYLNECYEKRKFEDYLDWGVEKKGGVDDISPLSRLRWIHLKRHSGKPGLNRKHNGEL